MSYTRYVSTDGHGSATVIDSRNHFATSSSTTKSRLDSTVSSCTYEATANEGYTFDYWANKAGNVDPYAGYSNPYYFSYYTDTIDLKAVFKVSPITYYTVSFQTIASWTGNVDSTAGSFSSNSITVASGTTYSVSGNKITFSDGQSVTVTPADANARYEYSIKSWSKTSGTVTGNLTISVTITRTNVVYTITIIVNPTGYGTVSQSTVSAYYNHSISSSGNALTVNTTTVTAIPKSATSTETYSFLSWSGIPSSNQVTSDLTIYANFKKSDTPDPDPPTPTYTYGTLSASKSSITVEAGKTTSVTINKIGCNISYTPTATVGDTSIASTSPASYGGTTSNIFTISGKSVGSTTIVFSNPEGATVSVSVEVTTPSTYTRYRAAIMRTSGGSASVTNADGDSVTAYSPGASNAPYVYSTTASNVVTYSAEKSDGYDFIGWRNIVTDQYVSYNAEYSPALSGNITLEAVFKLENTHYFTAVVNDSSMGYISSNNASFELVTGNQKSISAYANAGYTLDHWELNSGATSTLIDLGPDETVAYRFDARFTAGTTDDTIYAYFKKAPYVYEVIADPNEHGQSWWIGYRSSSEETSVDVVVSRGATGKTGWQFKEWNTKADGSGTTYNVNDTIHLTYDNPSLTVYAIWIEKPVYKYKIVYNTNGGSLGDHETTLYNREVESETNVRIWTIPDDQYPLRDGYTFDGWYLNSSFTGTKYEKGSNLPAETGVANETVTRQVYAKWRSGSQTIQVLGETSIRYDDDWHIFTAVDYAYKDGITWNLSDTTNFWIDDYQTAGLSKNQCRIKSKGTNKTATAILTVEDGYAAPASVEIITPIVMTSASLKYDSIEVQVGGTLTNIFTYSPAQATDYKLSLVNAPQYCQVLISYNDYVTDSEATSWGVHLDVTGLSPGTETISVTNGTIVRSFTVTVVHASVSLKLTGPTTGHVGETLTYVAEYVDGTSGTADDLTFTAGTQSYYSMSLVNKVQSGMSYSFKIESGAGEIIVRVKHRLGAYEEIIATVPVTPVTSIQVLGPDRIKFKEYGDYTAIVDSGATVKKVSWSLRNYNDIAYMEKVKDTTVRVNTDIGKNGGIITLVATAKDGSGVTGELQIQVDYVNLTGIKLTGVVPFEGYAGLLRLAKGEDKYITATPIPADADDILWYTPTDTQYYSIGIDRVTYKPSSYIHIYGMKLGGQALTIYGGSEERRISSVVMVQVVYRVTFDFNYEDAPEPEEYMTNISGRLDTFPEDPERTGFLFKRWMDENGDDISDETVFTDNITVYAEWVDTPIIKVNVSQGIGTVTAKNITTGNQKSTSTSRYAVIPCTDDDEVEFAASFDEIHFNFLGWYAGPSVISSNRVFDFDGKTAKEIIESTGISYSGKFRGVRSKVSFSPNGGVPTPDPKYVYYGEEYGVLPEPTKEGHDFSGWYLDGSKITSTTLVTRTEDHILVAKWVRAPDVGDANCYLVRMDADGNSSVMAIPNVAAIEEVDTASITEISTIIYGFDNNFVMDIGTIQAYTLSFERVQPPEEEIDDDGTDPDRWSNGKWFAEFKKFLDGWQNLNHGLIDGDFVHCGGFRFHFEPPHERLRAGSEGDYSGLYPVIDENVFINGSIAAKFSNNLQYLDLSVSMLVSTMKRSEEIQDYYEVLCDTGDLDLADSFKIKVPVGQRPIAPNPRNDWVLSAGGARFNNWNGVYFPGDRVDLGVSVLSAQWMRPDYVYVQQFNMNDHISADNYSYEYSMGTLPVDLSQYSATYYLIGAGGIGGSPKTRENKDGLVTKYSGYGGGGGSGAFVRGVMNIPEDTTRIFLQAGVSSTIQTTIEFRYEDDVLFRDVAKTGSAGGSASGDWSNISPGRGGTGASPGGNGGTDATSTSGGVGGVTSELEVGLIISNIKYLNGVKYNNASIMFTDVGTGGNGTGTPHSTDNMDIYRGKSGLAVLFLYRRS